MTEGSLTQSRLSAMRMGKIIYGICKNINPPYTHLNKQFYNNIFRYLCKIQSYFLFFYIVDRASQYNRAKKNKLDAQLILSIFRQPLHVSGVSRPISRRYNCMYTTISTYYSF